MKSQTYSPDQGYLLPPDVRGVLGEDHLCFFLRQAAERPDLRAFEADYEEEGRPAYHPAVRGHTRRYGQRRQSTEFP